MRTVEVSSSRADFSNTLGAIREWLDLNSRPLVRFETDTKGDSIAIKVRFDADDLAETFRQSFGGSYGNPVA